MIQMIAQASSTFHVTPNMLRMDEIVGQTPLKYLAQIQLVMGRIPTKVLYKLQVSVTQEVQSCAHTRRNRHATHEGQQRRVGVGARAGQYQDQRQKYHVDRLEQGLVVAYDKIPKSVQITEPMTTQKLIRL
jgi:hypothetical protein